MSTAPYSQHEEKVDNIADELHAVKSSESSTDVKSATSLPVSQAIGNFSLIKATFALMQSNQQLLIGRKQLKSGRQETNKLVRLMQKVLHLREQLEHRADPYFKPTPHSSHGYDDMNVIRSLIRQSRKQLGTVTEALVTDFATLPLDIRKSISKNSRSLAETLMLGVAGHPKNQIELMRRLLRGKRWETIESFRRALTDQQSPKLTRSGLIRYSLHLFVVIHGKQFATRALTNVMSRVIRESLTGLELKSEFVDTNVELVKWTSAFLKAICSAFTTFPFPRAVKDGVIDQLLDCPGKGEGKGETTDRLAVEWVLCHWLLQVILQPATYSMHFPEHVTPAAKQNFVAIGSYLMKIFQSYLLEKNSEGSNSPKRTIQLLEQYRSDLDDGCRIFCRRSSSSILEDEGFLQHDFPFVVAHADVVALQELWAHLGYKPGTRPLRAMATRKFVCFDFEDSEENEVFQWNLPKDQFSQCFALKRIMSLLKDDIIDCGENADLDLSGIFNMLLDRPLQEIDKLHLKQFIFNDKGDISAMLRILHQQELRVSTNLSKSMDFSQEVELAVHTKSYSDYLNNQIGDLEREIQNVQIIELAQKVEIKNLTRILAGDTPVACSGKTQLAKDIFVCRSCSYMINQRRNKIINFLNSTVIQGLETKYPHFPALEYSDSYVGNSLLDVCVSQLVSSSFWLTCEQEDSAFLATARKLTSYFKTYQQFFTYQFPKVTRRKDVDEGILERVVQELTQGFKYKCITKRIASLRKCRRWLIKSLAFYPDSSSDDYLPLLCWCLCRAAPRNMCSGMHMLRVATQRKKQEKWFADLSVAMKVLLSLSEIKDRDENLDSHSPLIPPSTPPTE